MQKGVLHNHDFVNNSITSNSISWNYLTKLHICVGSNINRKKLTNSIRTWYVHVCCSCKNYILYAKFYIEFSDFVTAENLISQISQRILLLVERHFITWPLIGWQSCQKIAVVDSYRTTTSWVEPTLTSQIPQGQVLYAILLESGNEHPEIKTRQSLLSISKQFRKPPMSYLLICVTVADNGTDKVNKKSTHGTPRGSFY